MSLIEEMLLNDMFWIVISIIINLLLYSIALYLANKNKHKIVSIILIIWFLIETFFSIPYSNLFPCAYFLFLLIRYLYKKITSNL